MTAFERYFEHRESIAKVLDPRTHTIDWLDRQIWTGAAILWAADDGVIVAEVRTYPTGVQELHGLIADGNVETIQGKLIPQAEQWARDRGFMFTSIASRPAWARLLEKEGYAVHQVYIRKDLF